MTIRVCDCCLQPTSSPRKCGDCMAVYYCSHACQKNHRKFHERTCINISNILDMYPQQTKKIFSKFTTFVTGPQVSKVITRTANAMLSANQAEDPACIFSFNRSPDGSFELQDVNVYPCTYHLVAPSPSGLSPCIIFLDAVPFLPIVREIEMVDRQVDTQQVKSACKKLLHTAAKMDKSATNVPAGQTLRVPAKNHPMDFWMRSMFLQNLHVAHCSSCAPEEFVARLQDDDFLQNDVGPTLTSYTHIWFDILRAADTVTGRKFVKYVKSTIKRKAM